MAIPEGMSESSFAQQMGGQRGAPERDLRAEFRGKVALHVGIWLFWAAWVWNLYERHKPEAVMVQGYLCAGWLVAGTIWMLWVRWRFQLGRVPAGRVKGSSFVLYACEAMTVFSVLAMSSKYGVTH